MIRITGTVIVVFGILGQGDAFVQHLTVSLIDHVLAYSIQGIEGLATIVAPQANEIVGHLFAQVVEQALNICAVIGVRYEERMFDGHVLEVLHQIRALMAAEQAIPFGQWIFGQFFPFIRVDLKIVERSFMAFS